MKTTQSGDFFKGWVIAKGSRMFARTRGGAHPLFKTFKKTGVLWFSPPIPPAGTLLDSGASREDNSDGEVFL